MEEMWECIDGFENYQISTSGKVFSLNKNKILKPNIVWSGYKMVRLYQNGWAKDYSIHRLVALTFVPNPYNHRVVNHKDGNKQNNYWLNLEWTTDSENQLHAIRTGLKKVKCGQDHGCSKLNDKDVAKIKDLYYNQNKNFSQIAVLYNVHYSTISRIVQNQRWTHLNKENTK